MLRRAVLTPLCKVAVLEHNALGVEEPRPDHHLDRGKRWMDEYVARKPTLVGTWISIVDDDPSTVQEHPSRAAADSHLRGHKLCFCSEVFQAGRSVEWIRVLAPSRRDSLSGQRRFRAVVCGAAGGAGGW